MVDFEIVRCRICDRTEYAAETDIQELICSRCINNILAMDDEDLLKLLHKLYPKGKFDEFTLKKRRR